MPDRKRLALLAAIMGSFVAGLDATVVNVALPAIERRPRRRARRPAVGRRTPTCSTLGSLILVGGSLGDVYGERRVFSLGVGGFGVVSLRLRARADDRDADRRPRAAGRLRRAADAERAGGDRRRVPARRARRRDRLVDGVVGHRDGRSGRSSAGGSSTRRRGAGSSRSTSRSCSSRSCSCGRACRERRHGARPAPPVDWSGAVLCALGLAGPVFALIRQPVVGWSSPEVLVPGARRRRAARAPSCCGSARTPDPMLPLGAVPPAQLRGRQPRDVRDVRRAGRRRSSSSCCSCSRSPATTRCEAGLATLPDRRS